MPKGYLSALPKFWVLCLLKMLASLSFDTKKDRNESNA